MSDPENGTAEPGRAAPQESPAPAEAGEERPEGVATPGTTATGAGDRGAEPTGTTARGEGSAAAG